MPRTLERTPSCEVTGLPLPILPKGPREIGALSRSVRPDLSQLPPDSHHHYHPERAPALRGVAGLAIRNSRIQKTNYFLHHEVYHQTFGGPELPEDEDQIFKLVVTAAAEVVPRKAIKLNEVGDWKIVEMNNSQHKKISKAISIDKRDSLAVFLADYASRKDIPNIINDDSVIDEFLDRRTQAERKRQIARLMLARSLALSVEDVELEGKHRELKDMGMINHPKPLTFYTVAKKIVRSHHVEYFQQLVSEHLHDHTSLQTGVTKV